MRVYRIILNIFALLDKAHIVSFYVNTKICSTKSIEEILRVTAFHIDSIYY